MVNNKTRETYKLRIMASYIATHYLVEIVVKALRTYSVGEKNRKYDFFAMVTP